MADLIARLKLDDKNFNDNIKKTKQELKTFDGVGTKISSSIKSLGIQFAAAAGVVDIFSTAIKSNMLTSNQFDVAIGTAKTTVDNFFTSLRYGDWSMFEKGIINAIRLSKKYKKALQDIELGLTTTDSYLTEHENSLDKKEADINSSNTSASQKKNLKKQYEEEYKQVNEYLTQVQKGLNESFADLMEGKNIKIKDPKKLKQILLETANTLHSQNRKNLEEYNRIIDSQDEYTKIFKGNEKLRNAGWKPSEKSLKKEQSAKADLIKLKQLVKENPDLALARDIMKLDEEGRQKALEYISKMADYNSRAVTMQNQLKGIRESFDKNGNWIDKTTKSDDTAPAGTLKDIQNQIKDKKIEIELATSEQSKHDLSLELKELEEKERVILFKIKYVNAEGSKFIKPKTPSLAKMAKINSSKSLPKFNMEKLDVQNPLEIKELKGDKTKTLRDGIIHTTTETKRLGDTIKSLSDIDWDDMNGWEKFSTGFDAAFGIVDGIMAVAETWQTFMAIKDALAKKEEVQAMETALVVGTSEAEKTASVLGGSTLRTAAKGGEAAANTTLTTSEVGNAAATTTSEATSTTAVVAGTAGRVAAKETESGANTKAAATGAAASQAGIPIIGPILAVAAIAAILAAIAAIPAFATGGIVGGNSYVGDKVLTRLNSGEMVLNKGQQANLFKMLNYGMFNTSSNQISFKLRGSDIYGSLTNYNKKYGKLR